MELQCEVRSLDTMDELRSAFEQAISTVSDQEIADLRKEMESIKAQTTKEMCEEVSRNAMRWYEQEAEELRVSYALEQSKINEEFNRKLKQERADMVDGLFQQVESEVQLFHDSQDYEESMKSKLVAYQTQDFGSCILRMGPKDQVLLASIASMLGSQWTTEVDPTILMGGFRIVLKEKGRMIDESYDRAFTEAKAEFLEQSGLIINE